MTDDCAGQISDEQSIVLLESVLSSQRSGRPDDWRLKHEILYPEHESNERIEARWNKPLATRTLGQLRFMANFIIILLTCSGHSVSISCSEWPKSF